MKASVTNVVRGNIQLLTIVMRVRANPTLRRGARESHNVCATRALRDPTEGRAHRAVLALSNQVREPQHAMPVRQTPTRPWEASLPQPAPAMPAGLGPTEDPVRVAPLVHTRSLPAPLPAPFAPVAHIPILRALQRQARARAALSNHRRRLAAMPSASVRATADLAAQMADPVRSALLAHTRSIPAPLPATLASVENIQLPRALKSQPCA